MNKIIKIEEKYPLVSIGIITYNQKEYLVQCIESCLAQDYPNFEIVVADDCSTDGTQDMLREYDAKYPGKFIVRLAQKNQGITPNSNAAHFACNGKYIAWMGGDDLMLPGKLTKQAEFMETNPECAICYTDSIVFESKTGNLIAHSKDLSPCINGDIRDMIKLGCFVGGCTAMVKKDCTPIKGFDVRVPISSDWLYWVESLEGGGRVIYLDRTLSKHRRHGSNITSNNRENFKIELLQDHLISCSIIISKHPNYLNEVQHQASVILRSLRWYNYPKKYRSYLVASFRLRFNLKSMLALAVSFFGKYL